MTRARASLNVDSCGAVFAPAIRECDMPGPEQSRTDDLMMTAKGGKALAASSLTAVRVAKGKTSVVTKAAVVSNAERYREAMIRLANR